MFRFAHQACLSATALALAATAPAQHAITIDGDFADWADVPPAYAGSSTGEPGIDFGTLWIANDDRFLYLKIELGEEINLSESNSLRLYIDTDGDSSTGLSINGIGAELEWQFGNRFGAWWTPAESWMNVHHHHIRLRSGPTVTSEVFEIAIGRDTLPNGADPLFQGETIRLMFLDHPAGDQLPASGAIIEYTFQDDRPVPEIEPIPLEREKETDLRLITWNLWNDGPWQAGQGPAFGRLVQAVTPDIINFQEVYDHTPAQAAAFVAEWLDPAPATQWHHAGNADCKTISRYPILGSWALDGNLAVLIDTSDAIGSQMLIINAHLPCCAQDFLRQMEIDQIMGFIRDAKEPGGVLTLADGTPIIITGDLNLVGDSEQLTTLLTGEIAFPWMFGEPFDPDWDGSDLLNLLSRQTEKRMGYTWRNDESTFWPGHLDYYIFTDSVLEVGRHYMLYTPEMSQENLDSHGLLATDSLASDHLLFAADFRPKSDEPPPKIPGDLTGDGTVGVDDLLILLADWGECEDPDQCPGDLTGDGTVGVDDLLILLANWG